jgi:membrane-associated phospholipid phosphatase
MPTGNGFLSGYGFIARSAYATPVDLGFKNWTLDFAPDGTGLPFPTDYRRNPYTPVRLEWQTDDWDPALRFWNLPFDPNLTEWLQDLDMAAPSVMAAREFARHSATWQLTEAVLTAQKWLTAADLSWQSDGTAAQNTAATAFINGELDQLADSMEDDRERYMAEALEQADGIPRYFVQVLAADRMRRPWTMELIQAALAIGNLAYMSYKAHFRRVRPSFLCPGLAPSFGPPGHPAFPSGHAFLGAFITLLLLEIPDLATRFGIGMKADGSVPGRKPTLAEVQADDPNVLNGPLFWLGRRVAKTRERMGLHYPSDSAAGRHLAGGIWSIVMTQPPATAPTIDVPTLRRILARASVEWT